MSNRFQRTSESCGILGIDNKLKEVGISSNPTVRFLGIPLRSKSRKGIPNTNETRFVKKFAFLHQECENHNSKEANVPDRDNGFNGKTDSIWKIAHATFPMVSQDVLELQTSIRHDDSSAKSTSRSRRMVGRSSEYLKGISPPSSGTQYAPIHRCIQQRLGRPPKSKQCQWSLESFRDRFAYKSSRTKGCVSVIKSIPTATTREKGVDFNRQFLSSSLLKQTGRHPFSGNVCSSLEDHGIFECQGNPNQSSTHSRVSECDCRCFIKKGQGDSDRMVSSSKSISKDLPNLAHSNGGHVCLQSKQQIANLHIPCTGFKSDGSRCIEYLLGRSRRLCLLSSGDHSLSSSKDSDLQVQDDYGCTRLARDGLVLGSHRSIDKTTSSSSTLGKPVKTTVLQQVPQQSPIPQSACLAPSASPGPSGRFSEEVEKRIKAPQRESSRKIYESRWAIFRDWCVENKVDIKAPSIPQIAEFLNYLFKDKNLKPSTVSGYRTAISDGLGEVGSMVSKSIELNRLLSSFHRDKPKINRSIPSWNLSLVLLSLTKAPFEPLGEVSMKMLTFKTVFLLALASGKRRSEIHAWTHSSLSFKRNWSQVTLAPSPAFLAKNQLASEGPDCIKPVVIPALKPTLDKALVEDCSLCPVRSLRYYLDRTKDVSKGKNLLFVSIRKGQRYFKSYYLIMDKTNDHFSLSKFYRN